MISWISDNFIEIFGAATGIIYVFLEIRQKVWLWPLGVVTSGVYVWIFFQGKLYADMSLQAYYVAISVLGWYWWIKGEGQGAKGKGLEEQRGRGGEKKCECESESEERRGEAERGVKDTGYRVQGTGNEECNLVNSPFEGGQGDVKNTSQLQVTRLKLKTGIVLVLVEVVLYVFMFLVLSRFTDSPVPEWDAFLTSLSVIATWMLARKIFEHWFLWIVVNTLSVILYYRRGLYPTVILYIVYATMSFIGLKAWKETIRSTS